MGVCALGDVCGSKTDPSGLRAYRTAFVIPAPATFFFPKLLHTKQEESFPCSLLEGPLIFVLIVGGCILIFLTPWTVGYDINIH